MGVRVTPDRPTMDRQPVARQRALKTRDTATCGDRYLAYPPTMDEYAGWPLSPLGKRLVPQGMVIDTPLIRHFTE